ncbi:scoloptoxin SSD14-like isoform X2 [Phymastichus coffea]|uniref:scoloptoxin SSD14-like isoform X2 n=1 Tax=Phymastichus coffea TaxID=108790 RepID=UPI00273C5946|nr:scoloptoxin SSD14-like isoform X2 [Phymastichus coffea]
MILPSSGGLDFDVTRGDGSYFALQPSNLSTPSSDDLVPGSHFLDEPALEHDRDDICPGLFYYYWHKPCLTKKLMIVGGSVLAGLIIIVIIISSLSGVDHDNEIELVPPDPEVQPPPSYSRLRAFKRSAVCADGAPCALIGKSILDRNGSAVDATIAALICNGMVNMQSMGLGGGFVMVIYNKATNSTYALNARDVAPGAADPHMYDGLYEKASLYGGLSIAVPGELAGYWEAHQRFGKLPWAELFHPNIDLCEKGYNLTKIQYESLLINATAIRADPTFVDLFVDPATNEFRKAGSLIRPKKLCETLKIIAEKNATEFYNGTLAKRLVEDLQKRGSIITLKDLSDYRAKWEEPENIELTDGTKVYSTGLPASGSLLSLILNVFDEFHFTPSDLANTSTTVKTYHRMIETFKYAYGWRTQLGDVERSGLARKLRSKEYARSIRMIIKDNRTWNDPTHYGAHNADNDDHGTAHISVMSENGDAVSVTSTINTYFASAVVSESTGKRPLSSMTPAILVDDKNDVKMTIGAAGGTKITTAVAFVIARRLWMNNTLKEAVDAPRIHHQIYPMEVSYELGMPKPIVDGLRALGHKTQRYRNRGSIVCVLEKVNGTIYANADYRKGGDVYGIN